MSVRVFRYKTPGYFKDRNNILDDIDSSLDLQEGWENQTECGNVRNGIQNVTIKLVYLMKILPPLGTDTCDAGPWKLM